MVNIFYCISEDKLDKTSFNYLFDPLPTTVQYEILKYRKWEDRQRVLFGKSLLKEGLAMLKLNTYSLDRLLYTKLKRPYFDDFIDFNISHSGEYIVCAISKSNKIGIDIEEIKEIPLGDFENEFSSLEMNRILGSENPIASFYDLWSQKEAFLKTIGTGLQVPLNMIKIINNKIEWNNKEWYLSPLKLDDRYASHLCSDIANTEIVTQKLIFY